MLLELLRERTPATHAAVWASLTPTARATLETAAPVSFIDVGIDREVIEAADRAAGRATLLALVEERQRQEMGSALFKSFVVMMSRLMGVSPATMVRNVPRGWPQLFRACGEFAVATLEADRAVLDYVDIPPVVLECPAWMACLPVGLRTLYELVGVEGAVTWLGIDATRRRAQCEFRWRT
jgi:hypothetical protein